MRCLRPLRVISRNAGMKTVVNSLLRALPGVANVVLVMVSLMLIFGILGVQLFMGKFDQCAVGGVRSELECDARAPALAALGVEVEWQTRCVATSVVTKAGCLAAADERGGALEWVPPHFGHFNNVFAAVLVLFEMSGYEQWPLVMYHGMSTVGLDVAPQRDHAPGFAVFFLLWVFIEAFCVNNLVIGVVVANFKQMKLQEAGSLYLLSAGQREWVDTVLRAAKLKPRRTYKPKGARRAALWEFVRRDSFEVAVQTLIVANVALMLLHFCELHTAEEWSGGVGQGACVIPAWSERLQSRANYFFTVCYFLEMALKLVAYGRYYFYSTWNNFDFVLVLTSLVDVYVDATSAAATAAGGTGGFAFNPATLRVLKTVRMARLLRLVRRLKRLRTLIVAFVTALPSFANILLLEAIMLFVFAVLGVSLFAHTPDGEYIHAHANFDTLQMGYLTLFSAATGENWNGLMHECHQAHGEAIPFFVVFNLIATFVLLNLVIAVILENYGQSVDDTLREVPQESLEQFRESGSATTTTRAATSARATSCSCCAAC